MAGHAPEPGSAAGLDGWAPRGRDAGDTGAVGSAGSGRCLDPTLCLSPGIRAKPGIAPCRSGTAGRRWRGPGGGRLGDSGWALAPPKNPSFLPGSLGASTPRNVYSRPERVGASSPMRKNLGRSGLVLPVLSPLRCIIDQLSPL
jgi:hypothetical protein